MKRLVLNDALPAGMWLVRGESPVRWILDWQVTREGHAWAVRIRGDSGDVGMQDNEWFPLGGLSAVNPDNPLDWRPWEIRVGWRHRWERLMESGWYHQTPCTAIEPVSEAQVTEWLDEARKVPWRPLSPAMDPAHGLPPGIRKLLGLDDEVEDHGDDC